MKHDSAGGLALIVGSICMLVTMAFHPSAGTIEKLIQLASLTRYTHALALVSLPILLLGFAVLASRLRSAGLPATAALVLMGFSFTAAMCAAVINGFAVPALVEDAGAKPESRDTLVAVLRYSHFLNAAFAQVHMVAAAAAMLCWSMAILKSGGLPAWAGWLAMVFGVLELAGVFAGVMNTSVHGFGLFVLSFSIWTIIAGALLCRAAPLVGSSYASSSGSPASTD